MPDLYDRMREEGLIDPVLVRASIESLIGEDCPYPTGAALARARGIHPEQLYQFLRGTRLELEPRLAKAFGLEKVVFYRPLKPAQAMEARQGGNEVPSQDDSAVHAPDGGQV